MLNFNLINTIKNKKDIVKKITYEQETSKNYSITTKHFVFIYGYIYKFL